MPRSQNGTSHSPTDCRVLVDWGDNTNTELWMDMPPVNETTEDPRYWRIDHLYSSYDVYNITIVAYNNVSRIEISKEFDISKYIYGLQYIRN